MFAYLLKLSRPVGVWEGGERARHGAKKGPPPPPHMTGGHSNIHKKKWNLCVACGPSYAAHLSKIISYSTRGPASESSRPLILWASFQ